MLKEKNHDRLAQRSDNMLKELTLQIKSAKTELAADSYFQTYSKAAVSKLPLLSKAIVDKTVSEMEQEGYRFQKISAGTAKKYAMTIDNIVDIYAHRGIGKYRDKYQEAFTVFIGNLKGGVSKTVSTVTLAHGLRTHPHLLQSDLRILVIDLDPQSSATMFLSHEYAIGYLESTSAQAMLQNVSREELLNEFVVSSGVSGVDVMPASIDDAFIASKWEELCAEHLPQQAIYSILKENIINKLSGDYDFIFIDSGPHLDAYLMNALAASDILLTPIPPAQVDFHSTLKYISRLPELLKVIDQNGSPDQIIGHIGFMSKLANKSDHKICHSLAKEIFGGDMLDAILPRRDGFERSGETYDTVFSINPVNYVGSAEALKEARNLGYVFAKSVFDRIEFMRAN